MFLSIYNKLRLAHFDYGRVHTILECSQHPLPWQSGSKFHPAFFVWFCHILIFSSFCNSMQCFAYVNLNNRSKTFQSHWTDDLFKNAVSTYFSVSLSYYLWNLQWDIKKYVSKTRGQKCFEGYFFKIVGAVWESSPIPPKF